MDSGASKYKWRVSRIQRRIPHKEESKMARYTSSLIFSPAIAA